MMEARPVVWITEVEPMMQRSLSWVGSCVGAWVGASCGAALMLVAAPVAAQPVAPSPAASTEPFLADAMQLTSADQFTRAGEAYFSPDGRWIIFQAVPITASTNAYAMYVARLARDERSGLITGLADLTEISPPGSTNTCGWFHPTLPGVVLFGCAPGPLSEDQPAGYSRDRSRYTWAFPREMEIVTRTVRAIVERDVRDAGLKDRLLARPDVDTPQPMWAQDGYNAEGSWSADGRSMVYTWMDPATGDADIYAREVESGATHKLIAQPGYDGGPFFSPDGKWIIYRSDRRGDNLLQLFAAELSFDERGLPTGVAREVQLTDNQAVNWAPFWHPDGTSLIYTTSQVGHDNYEVFAMALDRETIQTIGTPGWTPPESVRITDAQGFDGLPVFNPRGSLLMWTAQRGGDAQHNNGRASSQLWIARTTSRAPAGIGPSPATTTAPVAAPGGGMGAIRVRFGIMPGNYEDTQPGIAVADVTAGASAAVAGIKAGDRLMTWNATPIRDVQHWMTLMSDHEPGDVVKVGVKRDGAIIQIDVTLRGRQQEP